MDMFEGSDYERLKREHSKSMMDEDLLKRLTDPKRPSFEEVILRRSSKYAYFTSQTEGSLSDGIQQVKRWRLKEEIFNLFADSLKRSFPELEDESPVVQHSRKSGQGDMNCQNALSIWPKLRNRRDLSQKYSHIRGPGDVGEEIKNNLPKSDMVMKHQWTPSVHDAGLVVISLSRKWIVERIHTMIKDGIDTWAPELHVGRVIVDYPSLDEEVRVDLFQGMAIGWTLSRMLEYSKSSVSIGDALRGWLPDDHTHSRLVSLRIWAKHVLERCFSIKERSGDVVISSKGKPPFILPRRDFNNAYKDLETLMNEFVEGTADWIVYITPVRQQEYIEMCFTAVKVYVPKPLRTSYVGYQTCSKPDEFVSLLEKVKPGCEVVAEGDDAKLLGYTTEAVLDCVLMYTYLKNHRLAEHQFNINEEMLSEEGNTFVYLLNTKAKIRRITDASRKDINELKKASETILERTKGWGKSAERLLEFHLLGFTDALEQACLFVMPHILCEYLYGLSKKFNSYYSSVRKIGSIAETSTLLLCEATEVVMEQCFHLLGITREASKSFVKRPMDVKAPWIEEDRKKEAEILPKRFFKDLFIARPVSRGPLTLRNPRFELFSVIPSITTDLEFEFKMGKLFGLIAVSDKYGLLPDIGSQSSERDFTYAPLFKVDWCDAIDIRESAILHLGNPSSRHSASFSSSIRIWMILNVTTERKDKCFKLGNHKYLLDTSHIWEKEIDGECGSFCAEGEDGNTQINYILLNDAVDTNLEVRFNTKTPRQVCGRIYAYYGSDFPYARRPIRGSFRALLFESDLPSVLEDGEIQLKRSMLAVPLKGSLIIEVELVDADSGEVLFEVSPEFKSQREHISHKIIEGTDCSLDLKVHWNYQA